MKVSTLARSIIAITMAATSAFSFAADKGHGKITFKGEIIDAPCSITQDSAYQTIEMDQVSNVSLKNGGKSRVHPFKIELIGCELGTLKSATAKFTGAPASNPDLLAIKGSAEGASLALADHNGKLLKLGSESIAQSLADGDNYLLFGAYLQGDMKPAEGGGDPTGANIVPGSFETVANFTLDYQ